MQLMREFDFGEQENCNVFGDLEDDGGPNNGVNDYDDYDEPDIPHDMDPMDIDDNINPAKVNFLTFFWLVCVQSTFGLIFFNPLFRAMTRRLMRLKARRIACMNLRICVTHRW